MVQGFDRNQSSGHAGKSGEMVVTDQKAAERRLPLNRAGSWHSSSDVPLL
jgi:hypothetical protein